MDILDIDEALKDDSFIFLEDKTHDDVSNILQQWRNNNCTSSHNSEQAFKLNTRTFTRPKRKSAQNLEAQYSPVPNSQNATIMQQHLQQQVSPNVNLEIGGLVTNMQKSFLQDTSPPSSICSSMDVSMNGMNGSLITSADFTNINFLQSTRDEPLSGLFFDPEKATEDGYTLSDMIRDRKALESLTLSGEGTLIKDSNIAQIDDISLINSKTTSACSTMNNSTDSMGGSGGGCSETFSSRTCNVAEKEERGASEKTMERKPLMNETFPSGKEQIPPNGDEDFIGNTTFNLVDSSIVAVPQPDELKVIEPAPINVTIVNGVHNETFRKPLVDEAVCPKRFEVVNTTFDCSEPKVQCETPENAVKHGKYYEQSTPQQNTSYTPSMRQKQQYTPSIKSAEVNISPIVGPVSNRTLNETFDKIETHNNVAANILKEINSEKSWEPQSSRLGGILNADYEAEVNFAFETMKLLENINSNETFNKSALGGAPSVDAADEEAFDNLLDKIGKLELNEEQIKMRKSLDTIKKRFTYGMDKPEAKESSLISSSEMASSGLSMNSSGGGDRLLSRRSRLYDDINITKTLKSSPSGSINSISFVKETEERGGVGQVDETHKKTDEQHCTTATESTEFTPVEERATRNSKLEKRDRDRFKTIRIFKRHEDGTNELNVPCIDGELHHEPEHLPSTEEEETPQTELPPVERVSRRGNTPPVTFSNNKTEVEGNVAEVESNNYATFKKPKDKVRRFGAYGGGITSDQLNRPVIPSVEKPTEQRSLSRPRYLSGLQKFGATNKAISAGDLEKAAQQTTKGDGENFNKTQPTTSTTDLKSPMGIKSKSFHNLSSNFGYGAGKAAPVLTSVPTGVRKSTTAGNVLTEKQGKVNTARTTTRINAAPASTNLKQPISRVEKSDDQVFKTPGLVSGLRAPSAKRTGLVRPSSGYYGFSVAKGEALNSADLDAGRHSPTDSMSSASSRGSSTGKPITNGIRSTQPSESSLMPPPPTTQQPASKLTGIPKPSGLRPPSNLKRSGLPRPASIVRR